jgi:Ca2+/Na+ antiporter
MMFGTSALFGAQLVAGSFSPLAGMLMLGMGAFYIKSRLPGGSQHKHKNEHSHHHDHNHEHEHDHNHDHDHEHEIGTCLFHDHDDDDELSKTNKLPKAVNGLLAASGIAALWASADLIVKSGVSLADKFNFYAPGNHEFTLTQAAVGAVIVAIGTALPELSINLQAIRKKNSDLAIGNILGCTITNTLIAGGVISLAGLYSSVASGDASLSTLFSSQSVPDMFSLETSSGKLHTGVFLGSAALLSATILASRGAVSRAKGFIALGLYSAYIAGSLALGNGSSPAIHTHEHQNSSMIIQEPLKDMRAVPNHLQVS